MNETMLAHQGEDSIHFRDDLLKKVQKRKELFSSIPLLKNVGRWLALNLLKNEDSYDLAYMQSKTDKIVMLLEGNHHHSKLTRKLDKRAVLRMVRYNPTRAVELLNKHRDRFELSDNEIREVYWMAKCTDPTIDLKTFAKRHVQKLLTEEAVSSGNYDLFVNCGII